MNSSQLKSQIKLKLRYFVKNLGGTWCKKPIFSFFINGNGIKDRIDISIFEERDDYLNTNIEIKVSMYRMIFAIEDIWIEYHPEYRNASINPTIGIAAGAGDYNTDILKNKIVLKQLLDKDDEEILEKSSNFIQSRILLMKEKIDSLTNLNSLNQIYNVGIDEEGFQSYAARIRHHPTWYKRVIISYFFDNGKLDEVYQKNVDEIQYWKKRYPRVQGGFVRELTTINDLYSKMKRGDIERKDIVS